MEMTVIVGRRWQLAAPPVKSHSPGSVHELQSNTMQKKKHVLLSLLF